MLRYILIVFPLILFAQQAKIQEIDIDTTSIETIQLNDVILMPKLQFSDDSQRINYQKLVKRIIKVYPYAKLSADTLYSMNKALSTMKRERDKNRYTRALQKYAEGEFTDDLKKLSRQDAQILAKLVHRQTGMTPFELVKEYRSGLRAFLYQTAASIYDISLKKEFDPVNIKEDFLIEDILQRCFTNGELEYQKSAIPFNFQELRDKWVLGIKNGSAN